MIIGFLHFQYNLIEKGLENLRPTQLYELNITEEKCGLLSKNRQEAFFPRITKLFRPRFSKTLVLVK